MMAKYNIPTHYRKGFDILSTISDDNTSILVEAISNCKIGIKSKDVIELLKTKLVIEEDDIEELVQAIYSIFSLQLREKIIDNILADELLKSASSFLNLDSQNSLKLRSRLLLIIENGQNIKKTLKAFSIRLDNEHTYQEGRILTDIRFLFEENIKDQSPQNAVLIHNLKIAYMNDNGDSKSIYFALDSKDLSDLQQIITRAIEKNDTIIKNQNNFKDILYID